MDSKIIIGILIAIIIVLVIGIIAVMPNTQKEQSKIELISNASVYENETFSIKLTDLNNTPISDSSIVVVFKDQNSSITNKSVVTDSNGVANIQLNGLNEGNYSVNVIFKGNDKYINSTLSSNLTIKKIVVDAQKITSSDSSTSSSSSNDYYGPAVDSGGITREQAQKFGYSYTSDHGGHYIGPNDRWDEKAGVYHD